MPKKDFKKPSKAMQEMMKKQKQYDLEMNKAFPIPEEYKKKGEDKK